MQATPRSLRTTATARLLAALALTGLGASVASAQQSILYNFDNTGGLGATNFTSSFTNNGPSAGTNTYFGTGGIGAGAGSGNVNNFGTQPSLVHNTPIATAGVLSFNTSAFVKTGSVGIANNSSFFHIGLTDNLGANLRTDETLSNFIALRFVGGSTAGELSWNTRRAIPAESSVNATVPSASNFVVAANTWYKFDATFTKGAADTWNFTASVTPFGSDGLVAGSVLSTASGSIVQSGIYNASTLYGAIMYRGGSGANFQVLDNYSIVTAVPEPSAFAALAGLGALGFATARRRARR
jgi:hypothetical protein